MFNLISQFFKTKFLSVVTKINLKDIITPKIKGAINVSKMETLTSTKISKKKKWQQYFPFTFFYGNDKFQPIYFWIFCFCILALCILSIKVYAGWIAIKKNTFTPDTISTADLATVLTFISSLILLYNNNKKIYMSDVYNQKENNKEDKAN